MLRLVPLSRTQPQAEVHSLNGRYANVEALESLRRGYDAGRGVKRDGAMLEVVTYEVGCARDGILVACGVTQWSAFPS